MASFIDSSEPQAFTERHIKRSKNVPLSRLSERVQLEEMQGGQMPLDPNSDSAASRADSHAASTIRVTAPAATAAAAAVIDPRALSEALRVASAPRPGASAAVAASPVFLVIVVDRWVAESP